MIHALNHVRLLCDGYLVLTGNGMKHFLAVLSLVFPLLLMPARLQAQQSDSTKAAIPPNPFQILTKGINDNNYLASLLELQRREPEYLAFAPMREIYYELLTQAYAYVGDYKGAATAEEKLYEHTAFRMKARNKNAEEISESPLKNYTATSALKTIGEAGRQHQVIIINEEHRAPVHRALTHRLLSVLYQEGFRYFAAETLTSQDSSLNQRGYPTHNSGFYTHDPVYGDVIRQALKLGFTVVQYEHELPCTSEDGDVCQEERERGQAQNLYDKILKKDPQAKILVHAGRTHAAKTNYKGHYALMAWHFEKVTGIEPFTIDQVFYTELKNPLDELPLYRFVTGNKLLLDEPTIFESPEGKFHTRAGYDLEVFTTRVHYTNGRPAWLQLDGDRKPYAIDLEQLNIGSEKKKLKAASPLLVQAFVAGESPDAIPIDQIILYPGKEIPVLLLPAGLFRIRAIDEQGNILGEYDIQV